jgi:outer membrane receptor protein involved in Fe transport
MYKLSHKIIISAGILIILLFSASFSSLDAQQRNAKGTINGTVLDINGNTPLEQAIVRVLKTKDSTLVSGAATDANGSFSIAVPYGSYKIEASYTGYQKYIINGVNVTPENSSVTLQIIKLSSSNISTQEIDIEAQKPTVQITAEKKVINVENNMVTKGESAIDLLRRVPLVQVDNNDNVMLRGSSNVKFLVNGKPSALTDNLDQIPADQIKNIELITNPPAKYESEGLAGIINLVMKEDEKPGVNGKINLSAGTSDKYNGAFNFNLKNKKLTLTGNYFYNTSFTSGNSSSDLTNSLHSLNYTNENDLTTNKRRFQFFMGSMNYQFTPEQSLGLQGFYGFGRFTGGDNGQSLFLDSLQNLSSYYNKKNLTDATGHFVHLSLNYDGKFSNKGEDLSGNLTYSRGAHDNSLSQVLQYYSPNGLPLTINPYEELDTRNSSMYRFNSQLDYVLPFTKDSKFETGYKGEIRSSDNLFNADSLNHTTNNYDLMLNYSNEYVYKEQIYALYAQYSNTFGDFGFKAGLRGEQTFTRGDLLNTNQIFTTQYFNLFPTLSISQNLFKDEQVQLSYSRRITRPNYMATNPFVNHTDPLNIVYGNPLIRPEYTDSYELNFVTTLGSTSITPSFFYRQTHNTISRYSVINDSNITVTTYQNLAGSKSYGVDLIMGSQPLKWWNINATLSFYSLSYDGGTIANFSAPSGYSFTGNLNTSINLPNLFNLQVFYNYQGKRYTSQGTIDPIQSLDVAVSKNFFDNAFTVMLKATDLFKTSDYDTYIAGTGFVQNYTSLNNSRNLMLTLTYNFGKQENQNRTKKQKNNDEPNMNDLNGE